MHSWKIHDWHWPARASVIPTNARLEPPARQNLLQTSIDGVVKEHNPEPSSNVEPDSVSVEKLGRYGQ